MKTALRRELEVTLWQVLGFSLGVLALVAIGYFWGSGIESNVGEVARRQHRDHRHIVAIENGHPLTSPKGVVATNGNPPSSQPGPPPSGPSETPGVSNPPDSGQSAPLPPTPPAPAPSAPGLLTPTTEQLPEPAKTVVEGVCSAVSHAAHLC